MFPMLGDRVRAGVQRVLGASPGEAASLPRAVAGRLWEGFARPARSLHVPAGPLLVGVGGATLGGSGVTPSVRALASHLARGGRRICVVNHGYRAHRGAPVWVSPNADPEEVGDEAVELSRALAPAGIRVAGGGGRPDAIALASTWADVIVVDGLLQTAPVRLALGLLALEAEAPWGSGACPPAGDLRASPEALVGVADGILWHAPAGAEVSEAAHVSPPPIHLSVSGPGTRAPRRLLPPRPVYATTSALQATDSRGHACSLEALQGCRVGLIVGIARPDRVVRALARSGVRPARVISLADHAAAGTFQSHERAAARSGAEAWLVTGKCRAKLGERFAGAPVYTVTREIRLPPALEQRLDALKNEDPYE
jgi:tetraacyldisaccharide 4'-kinase